MGYKEVAGGQQPAPHRVGYRPVERYSGQVHFGGRSVGDVPRRAGTHRGAAQPPGCNRPLRPAAVGGAHRGQTGSVGRPGLPVADRRPAAGDPRSGIVGGAGLPGLLCLAAAVRRPPQLAAAQSRDRPDGRERPWGGGGAGLRPAGPGPGPGDGPPPHGVGPDRGAGPLQAQFRLAHLQPEAGGRHRRTGGGLVLLRRHPQVPGHGQFPGGGGWCRRAASPVHPRFPGMLPAPRLHLRPGQGAPSQRQAPGGAQRPVRSEAFLQRRQLQRTGTLERGIGALVSRCRRAASARHHQASAPGCLPWLSSLAVFPEEERHTLLPWDEEPYGSPTGGPSRCIPITTWPASTPSTRCRRPSVRRGSGWRSGWPANWCASTTGEGCSSSIPASLAATAPPMPPTTQPS